MVGICNLFPMSHHYVGEYGDKQERIQCLGRFIAFPSEPGANKCCLNASSLRAPKECTGCIFLAICSFISRSFTLIHLLCIFQAIYNFPGNDLVLDIQQEQNRHDLYPLELSTEGDWGDGSTMVRNNIKFKNIFSFRKTYGM